MHGMVNGKPVEGRVSMVGLYDPDTGHIAHLHRVVKISGDRDVTPDYVEQRARDLYADTGKDHSKLKAITIDPAKFKKGSRYKVDPNTSELVELPRSRSRD